MRRRVIFYLILWSIGLLAAFGEWRLYGHLGGWLAGWGGLCLWLALPLAFIAPHVCERQLPLWLVRLLAFVGGYGFAFVYYAILLLIPFALLWLVALLLGWPEHVYDGYARWYAMAALAIEAALLIGGSIQARRPRVREVEVTTQRHIPRPLRLAFLSDLHFGAVLGGGFARRLVRDVQRLQADIILVGGDVIDGNWHVVDRMRSLRPLAGLDAPLGVYAVLGNHDNYSQRTREERKVLRRLGIHVLVDDVVMVERGVTLVGMGDALYYPASSVPPRDEGDESYVIVMDHEPVRMPVAAAAGADLYLAGHTHAGQFWPNRYFTRRMFGLDYGEKWYRRMLAIVTSGYGAWGPQLRLGPPPEIVLVTVRPA